MCDTTDTRSLSGHLGGQEFRLVGAGLGEQIVESSVQEELRLGTLRIVEVPALRGGVPVTLVRRQNGYLSGAAQTLVAVIRAGATRRAARPRGQRARGRG